MSDNKIKKLLKQYGVEKRTKDELYEIKEEKIKKVQLVEQKKQEKTELLLLAEKATELRESEERQRVLDEEFERREKISSAQYKLTNPFSIGRKFDTDNVRKAAVDNILPKAFIPEQTSYPEPFEEEPALNKELSEFKRKINEHLYKMGFASSGGGGIGDIADAGDMDTGTAKVDGKFLKYSSSDAKWVGADASVSNETIQDIVGAMVSSNTETNITVSYQDGDGTLDFVIGTLNQDTTGLAGTATALATARTIGGTSFDGTANIAVALSATATALATGRTVGMTGDVVWTSASFDGTGNVTGSATIQANSVDGTMIALGSDAAGDVMYYNGTNYIRLTKGSDDEVLTLASGVPSWAASGSGVSLSGSTNNTVATVTGSNALVGEGNLTFNGSTLAVTGAITGTTDITLGDDLILDSDAAVIQFGDDQEIKLTHLHNQGLSITSTAAAPLVRRGEDVFIVLDQTAAAGTDAGDNIIMDRSAVDTDVGDDIIGEDEVFLHTGMQRDVINIVGSDGKIKKSIAGFSAGAI